MDAELPASLSRLLGTKGLEELLAKGGRLLMLRACKGCFVKLKLDGLPDEPISGDMFDEVPGMGGDAEEAIVAGSRCPIVASCAWVKDRPD